MFVEILYLYNVTLFYCKYVIFRLAGLKNVVRVCVKNPCLDLATVNSILHTVKSLLH
jgi:hypothetical protein